MIDFKLNKGQLEAVSELEGYILGEKHTEKKYVTISGAGGSGKTSLLEKAFENPKIKKKLIVGCAISNSASGVLAKSLHFANVMTIAKAFKEVPVRDKDGNLEFKTVTFNLHDIPAYNAGVLVIDECSMIGPDRLSKILEYTKSSCKIIFIGDICQLSVIETGQVSPVFDNTISSLTEIMRSNPILNDINQLFRDEILAIINHGSMVNPYVLNEKIQFNDTSVDDNGYYRIRTKTEFIESFLNEYPKDPSNPLGSKIISYTNRNIDEYNNTIREKLFGTSKEKYIEGDIILTETPYKSNGIYIPVNTYLTITNIRREKYRGILCYMLDIKTEVEEFTDIAVVDMLDYQSYKRILGKITSLARAKKGSWTEVDEFKNSFVSVSYGYAVNSHKMQGQTINNTFVCETEIKQTTRPSSLNKLQSIYVASSRAKNKIFMY